jgi:hypothetical protein
MQVEEEAQFPVRSFGHAAVLLARSLHPVREVSVQVNGDF